MKIRLKKQNGHKAFTLVELVVVVIIIGILASLGIVSYRKVIMRAKAGKAKNAISLIAEAEKIHRVDSGSYVNVAFDAINATIGANHTGMDLASVDSDTDFRYRVTGTNLIRGRPRAVIGTCPANNAGEIRYTLSTGIWTIPACYK